uniref:Phosphorylated adapter RNA export protein n=1 Tax=Syphacia muris TaxID=451379 RepID=A0A0N5AZ14_9BILA
MWSSFLEEKALTENLSSRADISGTQVERGVESYEAPDFKSEHESVFCCVLRSSNRKRRLGKRPHNMLKEKIVSSNYSLESLMSAEFLEGLTIEQLGKEIAEAMGEFLLFCSVVKEIGEEHALKLFNEVRDIEAAGGMKVLDGSRRRTPGGVYMVLFKSDPDVSQEIKVGFVLFVFFLLKIRFCYNLPTAAAVLLSTEAPNEQKSETAEKTDFSMDTSH